MRRIIVLMTVALAMAAMLVVLAAVPALAQTSGVFVSDVSPNGGSSNVAANSNITATFDVRMDRTTINTTTFYLKQKGSTTVVPAQVTYSGTTKTATLNPDANLTFGATYTTFVKGGRTGVKGAGGQTLGGTTDATATFANAKVSWTFTVATPPDTTIDSGPSGTVADRSASFIFHSSKENSTFQCSLDGTPFASCTSPKSVPEVGLLTDGSHTFRVRAIDTLGNTDATPARRTWTVDTIAPDTTIDTKPANPSNNASPSFTSCTSPKALSNLAEGSHTFSVRAKDAAGNVDATPDSYTWTVDTVSGVTAMPNPLDLSIDSAHGDVLFCQRSEKLTVTNNGPGDVTFEDVNITGTDAKYFSSGSQSALAGPLFFEVLDGNHFFDEVTFTAGPTAAERNSSTVYSATLTYKDGSGATIGNPVSLTAQAHCLNFGG